MAEDVVDRLRRIVAAQIGVSPSRLPDERTIGELGLDSLMLTEAVAAIEDSLGCEINITALTEDLTFDTSLGHLFREMADSVTV